MAPSSGPSSRQAVGRHAGKPRGPPFLHFPTAGLAWSPSQALREATTWTQLTRTTEGPAAAPPPKNALPSGTSTTINPLSRPTLLQQLLVRAHLRHLAVLHHDNAVRVLHRGQPARRGTHGS